MSWTDHALLKVGQSNHYGLQNSVEFYHLAYRRDSPYGAPPLEPPTLKILHFERDHVTGHSVLKPNSVFVRPK